MILCYQTFQLCQREQCPMKKLGGGMGPSLSYYTDEYSIVVVCWYCSGFICV